MNKYARLDLKHSWHPFTQMKDWLRSEPIVLAGGKGSVLHDVEGRTYLDANSSIWTNLHGHNHSRLNQALKKQLSRVAHTSFLGLSNVPATELSQQLVQVANPPRLKGPKLPKVFFSDDGSTALEVALKLSYQSSCRQQRKPRFLSLEGAYHGDTVGAVSAGHIDLFHAAYKGMLFPTGKVMSPYCYRCPFNRAKPERGDARDTRKCQWECVGKVEQTIEQARKKDKPFTALVVEPGMQGAAGMVPQPQGWLKRVAEIARGQGMQIIADEVMTGFGRATPANSGKLFASHVEGVQPDFLCLAKGLTGGYLPMAATLTSQAVFDSFLGEYEEFKTFFHGHSYTGNALGSAVALESLAILQSKECAKRREAIEATLRNECRQLCALPQVGDIRQVGTVVGIELVKDWTRRTPYALKEQVGIRVCREMVLRGVLTRPIGSVIVLMPPYSTSVAQVKQMVGALAEAIRDTLPTGDLRF